MTGIAFAVGFFPAIVIPVYFFTPSPDFPLQSGSIRMMFVQPPYWHNYKSWASEWWQKSPWSYVMLSSESCKVCLFLDLPHNNTASSPHTHTQSLKRTAAQSWLRKQPTAITTAQTGAALYRKTSAHLPVSLTTVLLHRTAHESSPKKTGKQHLTFLAPLHKVALLTRNCDLGENKRKMQLWCLE